MNQGVKNLTRSAIMLALAVVLSLITVLKMPLGGSVTAGSMVPIVLIALYKRPSWALLTSVAYAGLQMLLGFYPPPVANFQSFFAVVMLDYIVAFGALGLAGIFAKPMKNKVVGAGVGAALVCVIRFLCHFLSGVIIWGSGDPNMTASAWSFVYNGTYMGPELIITVVLTVLIVRFLPMEKLMND